MLESQQERMQRLSRKSGHDRPRRLRKQRRLGGEARAVGAVADERVADGSEVHTDLVRAPGFEPAFDKRRDRRLTLHAEALVDAVMGDRLAPPDALDLDLLAVAGGAAERRVDGALGPV